MTKEQAKEYISRLTYEEKLALKAMLDRLKSGK